MSKSIPSAGTNAENSNAVEVTMSRPAIANALVGGSLLSFEHVEAKAKEETSFPKMCYPNTIMEMQCKTKYQQGALWAKSELMPIIKKAIYLLRIAQPEQCSEWVEGVGDCQNPTCIKCQIENFIDQLEGVQQ